MCPAPCEAACVLGIINPPVSIELIEKNIVEKGFENGWIQPNLPEKRTGKKIAIIGSGPAGLAAAQQLNFAGHLVEVYERDSKIGGLLRYGIPDFKLEKNVIDRRIDIMQKEGVIFKTNIEIGKQITIEQLKKEFDIIECSGVLHHMYKPVEGLKALLGILRKNGLPINVVNFNEINGGSAEVIVTKKYS